MKLNILLIILTGISCVSYGQNSFTGVLNHTNSYFTMKPYGSSYDDGSYAKIFYDGKNKTINFWNSDTGTYYTHLKTGNLLSLGKIGVGTSNPKSRFHLINGVSGGNPHAFSSLTVEGANHSMISILTPNNKTAYFGFSDSQDDYVGGMQYEHSIDRLVFRTNNHASDLIINNNGNVGIGTLNSNWKLAVNGNILAKEIKVETTWSDFVFYEDYKLSTLQQVENYIKKEGHLKDIPSEKEVEKNGIFLGGMDAKLLRKIEELTLYTIQQQKDINTLREKNKELTSINRKIFELQKRINKLEEK